MGAILEQALKDLGMDALPSKVEVVFGKSALAAIVGEKRIAEATAATSFGGGRRVPRGHWSAYVLSDEAETRYVVGSPTEQEITRSCLTTYPVLVAAIRNAAAVEAGSLTSPLRAQYVDSPVDWEVRPEPVLGLDTEGLDRIESVSLAAGDRVATWQWSAAVQSVVAEQIALSKRVLAHYAPHDMRLLAEAGIEIFTHKFDCTMAAHRLLAPWRNKGLGYAAPLYTPCEPWKASIVSDAAFYQAMDAWVLPRMWERMWPDLESRRLEQVYEADKAINGIYHDSGTRTFYAIGGVEGTVERASACMETRGFCDFNLGEGRLQVEVPVEPGQVVCGIPDPYLAAFRAVSGHSPDIPDSPRHRAGIVRYMRGDGIDVSRRGLLDEFPTRAALIEAVPQAVHDWHDRVKKSLSRDDYVTNPLGRRWYYGDWQQAARFLLVSTIMDTYRRQILATGLVPLNQSLYHLTFAGPEDAREFLGGQSKILPKVVDMQYG